ncbi:GNAT family N-acetyltransferase [Actinokineospora globicatena]|uniref:GCN5 family N-acetyltransferase n=1 Tax=Actinokineospora globicatena TaxID=103729 RepID=A0A9W6VBX3_9PSEU|nr:GNAT family N-acetyltransferase [Actinokineospora globicatena]GLW93408.1 GCN5 family N-acetyltransferase [Actinokineospora globicatena]
MTVVRTAERADLPVVLQLIVEHAEYERAPSPGPGLPQRLDALLFGPSSRLRCLLAEIDGTAVGYATCAPEISTWDGWEYLHMDCLYLRPQARGHGIGQLLMDAVLHHARQLGMVQVQWQTPTWNEGAIRFYRRLGATAVEKVRFTHTL